MMLIEDDEPIQTFFTNGAHPAFGHRVGIRCFERDINDLNSRCLKHRVKLSSELRVVVPDQSSCSKDTMKHENGRVGRVDKRRNVA